MWINGQRNAKLHGQLSEERISRLESLPGWVWDAYKEKWETGLSALMDYVRLHGDAKVPMKYVTPQGFGLGSWISTARRKKSKGQISPNRIRRLEAVPGWSWSVLEDSWEEGFRILEEFVAERGDARVPTTYVAPNGYKLGDWVDRQRGMHLEQRLDQSREARLSGLPGWSWERKKGSQKNALDWEEAYCRLSDFRGREGHVLVPQHYVSADPAFGSEVGSNIRGKQEAPCPRIAGIGLRQYPVGLGMHERKGEFLRNRRCKLCAILSTRRACQGPEGLQNEGWILSRRMGSRPAIGSRATPGGFQGSTRSIT